MQDIDFYKDVQGRIVGFYKGWASWAGLKGNYTHRCYTQAGIGGGSLDKDNKCTYCKEVLTPEIKSVIDGLYVLLGYYE